MATFADYAVDSTGLPKLKQPKQPTLPYLNENGQNMSTLPVVQPTQEGIEQGNTQVMATAQNKALNQGGDPINQQTNQMVQKMQSDPSFGYNAAKNKATTLSNYDYNQSQAVQNFKNQNADLGGSGEINANLLKTILAQNTDRSTLENQLDVDAANKAKQDWIDAINAGNTQSTTNAGLNKTGIDNLLAVRGAYEGERAQNTGFKENVALSKLGFDQQTQMAALQHGYDLETMSKTFGNDMAKLMATQNFEGAQAQLNREAQAALQSNDINATSANIQKQLDYNKWALESGQKFTAEQNAINNALQVSLKSMDIDGQKSLLNLKAQIDSNQLVQQQDFQAVQAQLDRAFKDAEAKQDIQGQKDITALKGQIDAAAQEAQNKFTDAQRVATQGWQTGENIRKEDKDKAAQYFDAEQKRLLQANDIEGQKQLASIKNQFDLAVQSNSMAHDERMAFLNNQYAEAKANNDVGRQKDILNFTYTQDINKMAAEFGYDQAKIQLQGNIQKALQAGDFEHAEAMQEAQFTFQANQNALDRGIKEMEVKLQEKGIDLQKYGQQWDMLKQSVESGQLDPSVLTDFIAKTAGESGITLKAPDPMAVQNEAKKQYKAMVYQYALTHPDDQDPQKSFNDFYNKQMFGEGNLTQKDLAGLPSTDPKVQTAMKNYDLIQDPKSLWGAEGDAIKGSGTLVKIKDPATGKEVLATYDSNYSSNNVGHMTFTTTDGKKIDVSMGAAPGGTFDPKGIQAAEGWFGLTKPGKKVADWISSLF